MKGIILVGGTGSRLFPITLGTSKQLVPVYDKPMIYYPLSTPMLAGIRDILVITTPYDASQSERLLGDGLQQGLNLIFATQDQLHGLVEAFIIGADHIGDDSVALILDDNILYGVGLGTRLRRFHDADGGAVFAYWVVDPTVYGVVDFDQSGKAVAIQEKPKKPRSHLAVSGLYPHDAEVVEIVRSLQPSSRGELEITGVNRVYLERGKLQVEVLPRSTAWLDTGTVDNLMAAGDSVRTIEQRQGLKIGSPEEAAWCMGSIDDTALSTRADALSTSDCGEYLQQLLLRGKDVWSVLSGLSGLSGPSGLPPWLPWP